MREFLNILTESVGLANRKNGETFISPGGDLLTFKALVFYPAVGKFDNFEDLRAVGVDIEYRKQAPIEWVNTKNVNSLAFGVAEFMDPEGKIRLFGRYYGNINQIFTANYWPNSALPDGFRYNKASATKTQSGLMPQDVMTNMEDLTPEDILEQVTGKFGKDHPLTKLTASIVSGQSLPITVDISKHPDISFTGFRDYFNEILQPIAVIKGITEGNADEAASRFFGKTQFKNVKISFGSGKNQGLFDSLLIAANGQTIKLSSKGAVGATASVKNLTDAVKELEKSGNTEIKEQYADTIEIVNLVSRAGQSKAPLELAVKFGLISGKEASAVDDMRETQEPPTSKNLLKLYDAKMSRSDPTKSIPYYVMLSAIAEKVAEYVNDNTDFSDAAAAILNNSALIQVYTDAKDVNGAFVLQRYRAIYPSTAVGGVLFYAGKTYYSSGIKGNFTFKIFGSDKPVDDVDSEEVATAKSAKKVAAIDDKIDDIVTGKSTGIRPSGAARAQRGTSAPRAKR